MKQITKNMTFDELLKNYPDARKVLKKRGLACTDCTGRKADTLAMGALMNGIDIDEFLKDLRSSLTSESQRSARTR